MYDHLIKETCFILPLGILSRVFLTKITLAGIFALISFDTSAL